MNTSLQFIIVLLSSGAVAALVSAVMQKRNEKESRLFNAKLEAYKDFCSHLQSRFVTLTRTGKDLDIPTLREESSKCLLVCNVELNEELKEFLRYVNKVYERTCSDDYDKEA